MTFLRSKAGRAPVSSAMNLILLVGTMTGTAQSVAQELELRLDDGQVRPVMKLMDGLDAAVFAPGGVFLLCTSTYGQGDVPDNARALFDSLAATRPDLSRVRYGLIALGDRTYADTFCFGGKRFDALLTELGACRIGEPLLHDASQGTMPEEVAAQWIDGWMAQVREGAPA